MYYVTVIAFSHHVSVVMCFIHIIIIIIIKLGGRGLTDRTSASGRPRFSQTHENTKGIVFKKAIE